MSTVQRPGERYVEFDEYIEYQLDKARNGIKWTDILAAAAGVSALVIGYLVAFVVADHWVFEGGVPPTLRAVLLGVVLLAAAAWLGWKVLRPYLRRVNDLYAARMLEESEPNLRGSLFGLVDARRAGRPPADEVVRALEKRAATTLADVDPDTAIDRRPLMRTAYVLLGVVLVACAYAILSPKRVGPSILRALVPSSGVGVATRTEILAVKPGDAAVLAGTTLDVSVMIRGETPERVMLFYSTTDRRFADEPVELRLHDETTREYRGTLVGDAGRGLSQDLTYRVEANDDAAGPFAIEVEQPPVATMKSVSFQYPSYTGLEPTTRDDPPIDAIEGTNVSVAATANRPLKSAKLVFADDERFVSRAEEVTLKVADGGTALTASWKLAVRSDGTSPSYYRIECRDADGKSNPNPAVYPIAIRADKPPEVVLNDPKSDLERPANAIIPLLVSARDPDFRLRELTLRLEKNGQELSERNVLWEGAEQEVAVRHEWKLNELGLKPGDVVSYYVQARDNREPEFNRRNTPKLNVAITAPASKEQVEQQLAADRDRQEQELAEANGNGNGADRQQQEDGGEAQDLAAGEPNAERPRDQLAEAEAARPPGEGNEGAEANRNEPGSEQSPPQVKNDGTEDDEALRRLLEHQQREANEPQEEPRPEDQGEQGGESQKGESDAKAGDGGRGESGKSGRSDQGGQKGEEPSRSDEAGGPSGEGQQGRGGDGRPGAKGQSQPGPQGRSGEQNGDRSGDETANEPTEGSAESDAGATPAKTKPENRADGGEKKQPSGAESKSGGKSGGEPGQGETGDAANSAGSDEPGTNTTKQPNGEGRSGRNDSGDPKGPNPPAGRPGDTAGSSEPQSPQADEGQQGRRNGEAAPQNAAADGERTGQQPRPSDGDRNDDPSGSDDDRVASDPGRPNAESQPRGANDRNPGEGRPNQRTERPDSGEAGAGQPNADGTPDGGEGPGDAGTQPGEQQTTGRPTGRQAPSSDGRPGEKGAQGQGQPKAGSDRSQTEESQGSQSASQRNGDAGKPQTGSEAQRQQPGGQSKQPGTSNQSDVQQDKPASDGRNGPQSAPTNGPQSAPTQAEQGESSERTPGEQNAEGASPEQRPMGERASEQQQPAGSPSAEQQPQPSGQQTSEQQPSEQESKGPQEGQSGQSADQGQEKQGSASPAQGEQGKGEQGQGQSNQGGKQGENGGQGKGEQGQEGGAQPGKSPEGQSVQGEGGQNGKQSGQGKPGAGEGAGNQQKGEGGKGGEGASGAPPDGQGGQSGEGESGGKSQGGQGGGQSAGGGGAGGQNSGGGGGGGQGGEAGDAESANPDFSKQSTDLALKKLEDELRRGEVDQDLLKELGWTKEDAERFAERLRKNLSAPTGEETPQDVARRKEFERMLESLAIESGPTTREARTGRVKNVEGVGTKSPVVPSEYRDAWEAFTRSVAGSGDKTPAKK